MTHDDLDGALGAVTAADSDAGELNQAVMLARQALDQMPATDPDRPDRIATLAQQVRKRYEARSDHSDLAWLVELSKAAVTESAPGEPDLPWWLSALGGALRMRYAAEGEPADLNDAVQTFRKAVDLATARHTDLAPHENNLAVALSDRYDGTGQLNDLDGAIEMARRAVDRTPPGHPDHGMYLANLAVFLSDRYDHAGSLADLDEARAMAFDAADNTTADDDGLPRLHNLLAVLDLDRYERFGNSADLDLSILWARAAVTGVAVRAPELELAGYLTNFGNACLLRYEVELAAVDWSTPADKQLDVTDLRLAVRAHRRAVELAPEGSPDRPKFLTNLGSVLIDQAAVLPDEADLGEAIQVLSEAVRVTTAGSPHRSSRLNNLAIALRLRFERTGDRETGEQVTATFRASCVLDSAINVESVLSAADNWQRWATERRSWQEAVEACDAGLRAAALLHRSQLLREHQLAWLRTSEGLSGAAAFARCRAGDVRGAVAAMDGGRALLLADTLRRDRADLARLAEPAPTLAARYAAAARAVADAERVVVSRAARLTGDVPHAGSASARPGSA